MIFNKNSYCTNLRQYDTVTSQHNETQLDEQFNSKTKVLNKVRRVLVRHNTSPWVKCV